jgi:acyl dehydratase
VTLTQSQQKLYLEDLCVGDTFTSRHYEMSAERVFSFASEFDPQPFHIDPVAAQQSFFNGLAASGWHTSAVVMRLFAESVPLATGIIGAGCNVEWLSVVRPGDILHVVSTVKDITPSKSKPDRGIVIMENLAINQDDVICQRNTATLLVFRRP